MDKYPILRMVSTLVRIVGWVFLIISAILFFVGLANLGGNSILGTVGGILAIVNSLSLALFSLILIVIGEAVQVFIDIEKNTSMTAVLIRGFSHENSGNIGNPEALNTVSPNVFPKPFQSLSGTTLTLGSELIDVPYPLDAESEEILKSAVRNNYSVRSQANTISLHRYGALMKVCRNNSDIHAFGLQNGLVN